MGVIYAIFILDIISVQFPFLRHRLPKVKDKNNTKSGYCFINLMLIFDFKHFRTICYSFIIRKNTLSKMI